MTWIKTTESLPTPDNDFEEFQIVVEWEHYFTSADETERRANYTTVGRFNKRHKVWLDSEQRIIDDDISTVITHWKPLDNPPPIV